MINNLQYLRAFAAIIVVMFHIIGTANFYDFYPKYFNMMGGWGASGVHIFFVLSGFVMLHSLLNQERSALIFIKSRLIRIVPIYWFVTFLVVLSFVITPSSFINRENPNILWIAESMFFLSGFISEKWPVLAVGWTLELEMLFYIVFGLSLLLSKWNQRYLFNFIVLVSIAILIDSFIIFEFIFGMFAAFIYNNYNLSQLKGLFLAIIGFFLLLSSMSNSYNFHYLLYWGLPSSMIVLGLSYSKQYHFLFLKHLGDASYSLYLIHVLVISIFYKTINSLSIFINNDLLAIFCLLLCIIASLILYIFIERPITKYIKSIILVAKVE